MQAQIDREGKLIRENSFGSDKFNHGIRELSKLLQTHESLTRVRVLDIFEKVSGPKATSIKTHLGANDRETAKREAIEFLKVFPDHAMVQSWLRLAQEPAKQSTPPITKL